MDKTAVRAKLLAKLIDDMAELDPGMGEDKEMKGEAKPDAMEILSIEAKPEGEDEEMIEPSIDLADDEAELSDEELLAEDDQDDESKERFKKMMR